MTASPDAHLLPHDPHEVAPGSCHRPCCSELGGEKVARPAEGASIAAQQNSTSPATAPVQRSPESSPPSEQVLLRGRAFVPVPLAQLRAGERARVHAEGLRCDACDLLTAMGLTDRCELRVCKVGEPCIVQVNETRVGISSRLAREIIVSKLEAQPPSSPPR